MAAPANLLGLDASGRRGGVALYREGRIAEARVLEGRGIFARELVELAAAVLAQQGLPAAELDAVAVAIGPGSLTGMRVAISAAAALAFAIGRPTVAVSNLEALAFHFRGRGRRIASWITAGGDAVYHALYSVGTDDLTELRAPAQERPAAALELLDPGAVLFAGSGALEFRDQIIARRGVESLIAEDPDQAPVVALLGALRLARGQTQPPMCLRPLYLRAPALRRPD